MNFDSVINRSSLNDKMSEANMMKSIGIKGYKRNIIFYVKGHNNLNGIIGHNVVTKINCIITNYSVSQYSKDELLYNKTLYICDTEFPSHMSLDTISRDFSNSVHSVEITPLYAFSVSHLENTVDNTFMDLGLTMVDLNLMSGTDHAIINFSEFDGKNPKYKEIIYKSHYNPKYYTKPHSESHFNGISGRFGGVEEFKDKNTTIQYNTRGMELVDHFEGNVKKDGIYIDKKTIHVSDMLNDIFASLVFVSMERLEVVIDTRSRNSIINITELKFFTKFNNTMVEYLINEIKDNILKIASSYRIKFDEDYYMVCGITEQHVILDITFVNQNKQIRINKPLFKLYGEFSLKNENILKELEYNNLIASETVIEQLIYNDGTNSIKEERRLLEDSIRYLDNVNNMMELLLLDSESKRRAAIEDKTLWDEKEKFQSSHDS